MLNKFHSWPIRVYLMILVALVAVPAISLIVYSGINERREAKDGAKADCLKFVNEVAGEHQAIVVGAEQLATALALLPPIQSRNSVAANALFSDLVKKNPQYVNIAVCDKSGIIWGSAIPFTGKPSVATKRFFQEAIRTRMFSSGEYSVGSVAKRATFGLGFPVKNTSHEIIAVIGVILEINHSQRIFEKSNHPPGTSFSLLDHKGIILIRDLNDPFSDKLIGKPDIKEENFTKMTNPDEGTYESMGNDGKPRLVAYKKLKLPHESKPYLYIRSSIPLASATSKANAAMLKDLSLFVALFLVGLFLAWFIGERIIVNPVMMLTRASEQLAAGTDNVHVSHAVMGGELGELARTFDGMAEALVQRGAARNVAEAALRESEQRWATTLASVGDAVIATDVEGMITFMNAMAEALTGWTISEAAQKPAAAVFHIINEQTRKQVESPITKVLREGMVVGLANHTILVRKDGSEVPIDDSGAPIRDREGKTLGVVLVFHDITERRRGEEALRKSEDRLRFALETIHIGAWDLDLVDHSAFRSLEHDRIFGYAQLLPEWTYEMFLDHVYPEDRPMVDDKFRRSMENQSDWNFECRIRRTDGQVRWIWAAGQRTRDAAGSPHRISGIVQDITERKRAEEALKQRTLELKKLTETLEERVKERTEELSRANKDLKLSGQRLQHLSTRLLEAQEEERRRFAGDVHDSFSASLSAIKFRIEALQKEDGTKHEDFENLKNHVQDLIEEARRIQVALRPSILDDLGIVAALAWFTREFQKTYSHMEVTNVTDVKEDHIPDRLKTPIFRISQESLNNAAKHSKAKKVKLSLVKRDSFLQLEIEDNGMGFGIKSLEADGHSPRGLGLSSMEERASLSGGVFSIRSEIGKGTTVRISWPLGGSI